MNEYMNDKDKELFDDDDDDDCLRVIRLRGRLYTIDMRCSYFPSYSNYSLSLGSRLWRYKGY